MNRRAKHFLPPVLRAASFFLIITALGSCAGALRLPWDKLTDTHGLLVSISLYAGLGGWYLHHIGWIIRLSRSASIALTSDETRREDPGGQRSKYWSTPGDIERFARYWDRRWADVDLNTGPKGFLVAGIILALLSSGLYFLALVDSQMQRTNWGLLLVTLPSCIVAALTHVYRTASRLHKRIHELERKEYL